MTIDFAGRTAMITGASSGIGSELAVHLAARGADLVLVARREDRLNRLAEELRVQHRVEVTPIALDLAQPGIGRVLAGELERRGLTIHSLVNNAGFGTHGDLAGSDQARNNAEVQLNVASLMDLTQTFWPRLLEAGDGALVNVASTAAFQPVPGMAVYAATKAFVRSFTEALWYEAKGTGVTVVCLCPGPTETEFFDVVGNEHGAVGQRQTPDQVVRTLLAALDRRFPPPTVVCGVGNKAQATATRLVPTRVAATIAGRLTAGE